MPSLQNYLGAWNNYVIVYAWIINALYLMRRSTLIEFHLFKHLFQIAIQIEENKRKFAAKNLQRKTF